RAIGSGAGNVDEGHLGIQAAQGLRGGQRDVVGHPAIVLLRHSSGGDTEAEKAGVEGGELWLDGLIIGEIAVNDFAEFWTLGAAWGAANGLHDAHVGIGQALAENALADHSRCAEDEDVHYRLALRDGDVWAEVDVLNGVEQLHAFFHGALEGFTTGDEPGAAGALVDHGRGHGFLEIVRAGGAAGVDQARAAGKAVDDLVAAEVDGVIAVEVRVDALIELAVAGVTHVECLIASVIFSQLLLDDVGLNGDAKVIGLAGQVGRDVVILVFFEGGVAHVAPQDGGQAQLVSFGEGPADFDDLAIGLLRAEVDGGADSSRTHLVGFADGAEQHLIEFVGVGQQFVVVEFDDEGNLVGVFARNRAQDPEGGGDGVALAFDGELHDVF